MVSLTVFNAAANSNTQLEMFAKGTGNLSCTPPSRLLANQALQELNLRGGEGH